MQRSLNEDPEMIEKIFPVHHVKKSHEELITNATDSINDAPAE